MPETWLDAAFLGRHEAAMQELLDRERASTTEFNTDQLGALHSRSLETSPGNPHALVKDQHVISREHISLFAGPDGRVCAMLKANRRRKRVNPKNNWFCAARIWSNHAELWMQHIEKRFSRIACQASGVHDGTSFRIDGYYEEEGEPGGEETKKRKKKRTNQNVVTEYWALCRSRVRVRDRPPRPVNLRCQERQRFSQEEKDALEYDGLAIYSTEGDETRATAEVMVRHLMDMDMDAVRQKGIRWCVGIMPADTVVLPDLFPYFCVPISHDLVLLGIESTEEAPPPCKVSNPAETASLLFSGATRFVAARSAETLTQLLDQIDRGEPPL
jgi:hypothetical protein